MLTFTGGFNTIFQIQMISLIIWVKSWIIEKCQWISQFLSVWYVHLFIYDIIHLSWLGPLQHIQNLFSIASVTSTGSSCGHILFKTIAFAFKAVNDKAPIYLPTLVRPRPPARAPRSTTSAGQLVPPSLRANKGHSAKSQLFSVLAPQWWNELLTNVRTAESLAIFQDSRLTRSDFTSTLHSMTPWITFPRDV